MHLPYKIRMKKRNARNDASNDVTLTLHDMRMQDMPFDGHSHKKQKSVTSTATGSPLRETSSSGGDGEGVAVQDMKDGDVYVSRKLWFEREPVESKESESKESDETDR